jgi:hypothetical protein
MANPLFERYVSGEQEEVWRDLVALGQNVRCDPHLVNAKAVAAETMKRTRHNFEQLKVKLDTLGFRFHARRFGKEKPIIGTTTADTWDCLDRLEQRINGPLPISVRSFYEQLDGVCFFGYHPILTPQGKRRLFQAPQYRGSPIVLSIRDAVSVSEDWNSNDNVDEQDVFLDHFELVFENERISWEEWTMDVPNAAMDARIDGLDMMFVEYLRRVFQWGGFPGWAADSGAPTKEIEYLRDGLLRI